MQFNCFRNDMSYELMQNSLKFIGGDKFANLEASIVRHYICQSFFITNKSIDIEHFENKKFYFPFASETISLNHLFIFPNK